jgi:protocatechuate 3,4-dioxygenase beta subunit
MFESASSCSLTPEQMEGPYYIDVDAIRSDIRDDREGSPLLLGIRVLDEACAALPDAVVEVWHCDAVGTYSGFERESAAANDRPGGSASGGDGTRFLRGGQVTDGDGIARIRTIYPGWYQGRAVHVHAKVHIGNAEVLTTQLYFDDAVSDEVFATSPYDEHAGARTRNEEDGIFADGPVLSLSEAGGGGGAGGHLGLVTMTVSRA